MSEKFKRENHMHARVKNKKRVKHIMKCHAIKNANVEELSKI